ncbi:unnamed protein product [Protopolystoma xenopodis]|uniref:Uncharacterized protein n=1 Tax=Protopolystoma xenopodis TaxID=117903 RepID=A0A448WU53_9PLAT|nr:unnamed protein product [Protopolystoma xenopodis]
MYSFSIFCFPPLVHLEDLLLLVRLLRATSLSPCPGSGQPRLHHLLTRLPVSHVCWSSSFPEKPEDVDVEISKFRSTLRKPGSSGRSSANHPKGPRGPIKAASATTKTTSTWRAGHKVHSPNLAPEHKKNRRLPAFPIRFGKTTRHDPPKTDLSYDLPSVRFGGGDGDCNFRKRESRKSGFAAASGTKSRLWPRPWRTLQKRTSNPVRVFKSRICNYANYGIKKRKGKRASYMRLRQIKSRHGGTAALGRSSLSLNRSQVSLSKC